MRLLVDAALRRQEGRREVDLETRKLNEGVEPVVMRPRLGERQSVLAVGVLGFTERGDSARRECAAVDAESDTVRGSRLHLELVAVDRVVLRQEVVGGLAEVLDT